MPRRINCGPKSANMSRYRRDYYVNADGKRILGDSTENSVNNSSASSVADVSDEELKKKSPTIPTKFTSQPKRPTPAAAPPSGQVKKLIAEKVRTTTQNAYTPFESEMLSNFEKLRSRFDHFKSELETLTSDSFYSEPMTNLPSYTVKNYCDKPPSRNVKLLIDFFQIEKIILQMNSSIN